MDKPHHMLRAQCMASLRTCCHASPCMFPCCCCNLTPGSRTMAHLLMKLAATAMAPSASGCNAIQCISCCRSERAILGTGSNGITSPSTAARNPSRLWGFPALLIRDAEDSQATAATREPLLPSPMALACNNAERPRSAVVVPLVQHRRFLSAVALSCRTHRHARPMDALARLRTATCHPAQSHPRGGLSIPDVCAPFVADGALS